MIECATDSNEAIFSSRSLLATGSSKGVVQLFDVNQSAMTQIEAPKDFSSHKALLSGLKFDPGNDNIIYVSRVSGECSSFDLRSNEVTYKYSDDSNGALKTFTCIDVNQNSRILCCGTDKIRGDAFLLFFETRQRKLLGGYWESHEDDITNVSFIYKRLQKCLNNVSFRSSSIQTTQIQWRAPVPMDF